MAFTEIIKNLFANLLFLCPLVSLVTAQLIKGIIYLINNRKKNNPKELFQIVTWGTGGMPSSHSALVCSLCTSAAFEKGIDSDIFAVSLWFTIVVLRDALGVRRSAGQMAKALNNLGKHTVSKIGGDFTVVKEILGHTPVEVTVGGTLGFIIAIVFQYL